MFSHALRILALAAFKVVPIVLLLAFALLFTATVLARLDILNLFGGAVVYSKSMEPSVRRWDMAIFISRRPSIGDVVVYCLTRSFCAIHRYVADCPVDGCIVTKGDANPAPDPFPVSLDMVKGVATYIVPREIWIPLFFYSVALALVDVARTRTIGVSATIVYTTVLLFILVVYGLTQPPPATTRIDLPVLYLSRVDFNHTTCTISVGYVGVPKLTDVEVYIDGARALAQFNETYVLVSLPKSITGSFVWRDSIELKVVADLERGMGRLRGSYSVRLYGEPLEIEVADGHIFIRNPNCFPVPINVTLVYAYNAGDIWRNKSAVVLVEGFSVAEVVPPKGARYVYADISYRIPGGGRWMRIAVRYG